MNRLRRTFRVLRRLTVLNLGVAMAYRGSWLLFMLAAVTMPVISLLIWRAALANGASLPVEKEYLTTYFVLLGVVSMLTSSWLAPFLADEIRKGELSKWLIRPAPSQLDGISNNLTEKLLKLIWHTPAIVVLWWIFRGEVRVPGDPVRWLLFGLSVVLAAVLVYTVSLLIGSLGFWFDDVRGVYRGYQLLHDVLSGAIVPLALMPDWSRAVMDVQPFRFMLSFPLEVVIGELTSKELTAGIALQAGYVGLAVLVVALVWRAGVRSYSAVGA
ncbi:ABC transporter permease [Flindersiella endophytica]